MPVERGSRRFPRLADTLPSHEREQSLRRIGVVQTKDGAVQLSLDPLNRLSTESLAHIPTTNDQTTLDLSWLEGEVEVCQLGLDPTGSNVVQDIGEPRLINWHATLPLKDGGSEQEEQWLKISNQRLAHLFLDPLDPSDVDLSRLVKLTDEKGGVNYAILELIPDSSGDESIEIPLKDRDEKINAARLFLIQPPTEDLGAEFGPKTSLAHLLNDLRAAVVDSHNDRDARYLDQLAETAVGTKRVQFVQKDGETEVTANDDLKVLEALYKAQLVVAGMASRDNKGYESQLRALIPTKPGRSLNLKQLLRKLSRKAKEPQVTYGVGDFLALYDLDDNESISPEGPSMKGVVVENKAQNTGSKRDDLLDAYRAPRYIRRMGFRYGRPLSPQEQKMVERSGLYKSFLEARGGRSIVTEKVYTTGLHDPVRTHEARDMLPHEILFEVGTRLWDGSRWTRNKRLISEITSDHKKPLIEGCRSLKILSDNFLSIVGETEDQQLPAKPINTKRNPFADETLRYANLYPHHVLRLLGIVNPEVDIDNMDFRAWTDAAVSAWVENVVGLRKALPDVNLYSYYGRGEIVTKAKRGKTEGVRHKAGNLVRMAKTLYENTFSTNLTEKDMENLGMETYEVGLLQQVYFGFLTEYDRLARKGATDEQFRPFMQQVHDLSKKIIGIENSFGKR